ncbi:MAG: 3-dehydroquinate synthase family protein [Planctomycetota bacterium]
MEKDERESGLRAILNFGHTVGHAIESAAGFAVSHGEAVGIGMICEARIAVALGMTADETPSRIEALVRRCGLPTRTPKRLKLDAVLNATQVGKKVKGGRPIFVLPEKIGIVRHGVEVPDDILVDCLKNTIS